MDNDDVFKRMIASVPLGPFPCVYIARTTINDDVVVLYVGKSSRGINRPLGRGHDVLGKIDRRNIIVDILRCDDNDHATHLEEWLIISLNPTLNKIKKTIGQVADSLVRQYFTKEKLQEIYDEAKRQVTAQRQQGTTCHSSRETS